MKQMKIQAQLPVSFLREGKAYIAYTPALDISTSGRTFAQTQKRFGELVELFFEELMDMGTLETVLLELGWEKQNKKWVPPTVVAQQLHSVSV
ncbi:hypothetical protein A2755_03835 [Candidatus Wolfebacteria bacterium RIFCSPHIGHO2_01_FULL_48_22]|uniref:HicB-like antitoxin of toxin-antitoxin system domain-containing protein n=2 Tax=Candidatus Wolfeibacteriota TaxID=1752735 RepID=A0A1F8DNT0_9BACT|nr:MAG: hypothetical protein A2755_03835 [Candidatus Wolfebacteria bacterium RIFCSPHIGHO2_01_FULL_48_22]OGM93470.1 MAG: hypothetical protein A2935_01185 [Candidatus Wolfebacteria bacterium RIFCSPLOWO2_01_FULL_47_17b]